MTTTLRQKSLAPQPYMYDGELKRALDIADAYGFRLLQPLRLEPSDRTHAENYFCPEHHVAALRTYENLAPEYLDGVARFAHTRKVPYKNRLELRLEVLGDRESSAEGLLFQVAQAILREHGHPDPLVTINTVGGKESVSAYAQSTASYFRSRMSELDPECRQEFKKSHFAPMRCTHPTCMALRADAPQSLNFLTEQSKQHFKEVLEYLESFGIAYAVDPFLVGSEHYTTRTLFTVGTDLSRPDDTEAPPYVAWGERYDQLAKKVGLRRSIPAVNLTLDLGTRTIRESFRPRTRVIPTRVHVIHAGLSAKMYLLKVAEKLRESHIRSTMALHKNSVADQLEQARASGVPYLIIVGQKEALDGTVMIRHVSNSRQESVPLARVAIYLKKIGLKN